MADNINSWLRLRKRGGPGLALILDSKCKSTFHISCIYEGHLEDEDFLETVK